MSVAQLIQGNEAIALGALYAGANFYAGYPITPSSEIAEYCSRELLRTGGIFIQMEDEIGSMAAIIGASGAGAKAFTATSGPGFSLMQENLSAATIMEMPVVIINVQRAGPCLGIATKPSQADVMQLRWGRHGDQNIIALVPSSVKECFELTVEAFNLAETFRTPVVLAPDETVGHMREDFVVPKPGEYPVLNRKTPTGLPAAYKPFSFTPGSVAPLAAYGSEYIYATTASMNGEDGFTDLRHQNAIRRVAQLYTKFEARREQIVKYKTFGTDDCDTLLIAYGGTARAARSAMQTLRSQGKKVGLFQPLTIWPFPDREITALAKGKKAVVVPELNYDGQIAGEVSKYLGDETALIRINSFDGQVITPETICSAIQ